MQRAYRLFFRCLQREGLGRETDFQLTGKYRAKQWPQEGVPKPCAGYGKLIALISDPKKAHGKCVRNAVRAAECHVSLRDEKNRLWNFSTVGF